MTYRKSRQMLRRMLGKPRLRFETISVKQAASIFKAVPPGTAIPMLTLTEAREVGPGHPFGVVMAAKLREAILNKEYSEVLNEKREAEGLPPRATMPRSWGENIGLPFVIYYIKGQWKLYLSIVIGRELADAQYFDRFGHPLTQEEIAPYLKHREAHNEVQYRNVSINNVMAIVLKGPRGGLRGYSIVEELPKKKKKRRQLITSA